MVGIMPSFSEVLFRTFVCVTIPQPQLKIVSDWLSARRRESKEFKWACSETMHITLTFCGEMPPETIDRLLSNLRNISQRGPFDINIEGVGGFPDLMRPRVMWAGVGGNIKSLFAVRNEIEKAALKSSIPKEDKKYIPHVTIGRRNSYSPLPEDILSSLQSEALVTEPWTVSEITLMKSELSPIGARHTQLGLFKI